MTPLEKSPDDISSALESLKQRYLDIGRSIRADPKHLQFHRSRRDDGSPHVEIDGQEFIYVYTERGERYDERRTTDQNELLYWLVYELTFSMAVEFELLHRRDGEDYRRQIFSKQIELLEAVDTNWARRVERKIQEALVENPYKDEA